VIIPANFKQFSKIAVSFGLVALVGVLTVLSSMLIGRFYGPSGLGLYATVISIGQILGTLCGTSVGTYAITKLPALIREQDSHQEHFMFRLSLLTIIFTSTATTILFIFLHSSTEFILLLLISASIIAHSVQNYSRDILRCHGAIVRSYFVLITTNSITIASISIFNVVLDKSVSIKTILLPALAATIIIALFVITKSSFFNGRDFLHYLGNLKTSKRPLKIRDAKDAAKVFLPMIVASVAQVTLAKTDILIASKFGSITLAGELTASVSIASIAIMGLAALNAIYVPRINAASKKNANSILREVQKMGAILTIVASVSIYSFDTQILNLFGFDSKDSILALRILLVGAVINALTGPVIFVGLRISNGKPVAMTLGAAVIVNIVGDILVFNTYGIVGLAFVTALVSSATNLAIFMLVIRE